MRTFIILFILAPIMGCMVFDTLLRGVDAPDYRIPATLLMVVAIWMKFTNKNANDNSDNKENNQPD